MTTPLLSIVLFVVAAFLGALGQFLYKSGAERATAGIMSYLVNPRLLAGVNWRALPHGVVRLAIGTGVADGAPDTQVVVGYSFDF